MNNDEFKYKTREEWLVALLNLIRPRFEEIGFDLPANVRIALGICSGKAIGQHYSPDQSADNHHEIFISPKLDDPMRIAGVIVHECIHTQVDNHGRDFTKWRIPLLLDGPNTATTESPEFMEWAKPLLEIVGPLPHAALKGREKKRKKPYPLVKAECPICEFNFRASRRFIPDATTELRCPTPGCEGKPEIEMPPDPEPDEEPPIIEPKEKPSKTDTAEDPNGDPFGNDPNGNEQGDAF